MNPFSEHFDVMIGGGYTADENDYIGNTYREALYQRGYGFRGDIIDYDEMYGLGWSDTLRSIFNFAKPLLKRGAEFLGKKAVDTVSNIAHDAISGENIKESAKRHITDTKDEIFAKAPEAVANLLNKSNSRKRGMVSQKQTSGTSTRRQKKRRTFGRGILETYPFF
jgi:hypothetical protein